MLRGRLLSDDSSSGDDGNLDSLISIGVPALVVALLVLALRLQLPQRLYAFVAAGCKTAQTRTVEGVAFYFALADALQLSKTHYSSMDSAGGKTLKSFAGDILSCLFWQPPQQSAAVCTGIPASGPLLGMLHGEFIKMQHLCRRGEPVITLTAGSSFRIGECCRGNGEEPLANRVVRCLAEAIAREEVIERACTTRRNQLLEWFVGGVLVHDLAQGPAVRGRVLCRFLRIFRAAGGDDRVVFVPPDPCSVLFVEGGVLRGLAPSAVAVHIDKCDFITRGQHLGVYVKFEWSASQHAVVTVDGVEKSLFNLDEVKAGAVRVARKLPSARLSSTELKTSTVTLKTVCTLPGGDIYKSAPSTLAVSFEPDAEYELQAMSAHWRSFFMRLKSHRLSSDTLADLNAVFQSLYMARRTAQNAAPAAAAGAGDALPRDVAVAAQREEIEPVDMFKGVHAVGRKVVIGDAGMGKTTLLKYLAHLWAGGNCPALSRYEHVFIVTLSKLERYFNAQQLQNAGAAAAPAHAGDQDGHVSPVVVQWLMQGNAWGLPSVDSESVATLLSTSAMDEKVLWLIDGVDEIQLEEGRTTDFQAMVLKPLLKSKNVVVTSRPMLGWVEGLVEEHAKRYVITGLSSDASKAFVESYVRDHYESAPHDPDVQQVTAPLILQRLSGESSLETFSKNPCLLEAVCCLAVEGKLPVTGAVRLTDVYSNFTAVLEHRGFLRCTRDGGAARPGTPQGTVSNQNRATLRAFVGSVARHTWENSQGGNPIVQPDVMDDTWNAHDQQLENAGLSQDTLPRLGFLRPEQTGVGFTDTNWFFLHKSLLEWYTSVYLAVGLHTGQVNEDDLEGLLKARTSDIVWPLFFGCVFDRGMLAGAYSRTGEQAARELVAVAVGLMWNQPSVFFTLLSELPPDVALRGPCLWIMPPETQAQLISSAIHERRAKAVCLLLRFAHSNPKRTLPETAGGAAHDLLQDPERHQSTLQSVFQHPPPRSIGDEQNDLLAFQRDFAAVLVQAYSDARYSVTEHCGRHPMAENVRLRMKQLLAEGAPADCAITSQLFLFGCGEGDLGLVQWCLGRGACASVEGPTLAVDSTTPTADRLLASVCISTGFSFACGRGHLETVHYLISQRAIAKDEHHPHIERSGCGALSPGQAGAAEDPIALRNAHDTNSCSGSGASAPSTHGGQEDTQQHQPSVAKAKRGEALTAACRWGHLEVARYLLSLLPSQQLAAHADRGVAAPQAGRDGHLEVVRELLGLTDSRQIDVQALLEGAFRQACEGGYVEVVRELLALTGDRRIDVHAEEELTFGIACLRGHVAVVRELLGLTGDRYIDVHTYSEGAFQCTCMTGYVEVVRELLALTGDRRIDVHADDEGGFRAACQWGGVDVVRELLDLTGDRRIDVHADGEGAFRAACEGGRLNVVRELLGLTGDRRIDVHADDEGAFRAACEGGHVKVVRELLGLTGDRRIDVHADDEGAFRAACEGGHVKVVRELLGLTGDRRIDVHANNERAFRAACEGGRVEVVRELLGLTGDQRIDVHANNELAFQSACEGGRVEVVRELLGLTGDRRIDVHADNELAFRAACGGGHMGVVRRLLGLTGDRRINVHAYNFISEGAFRAACGGGHVEVVRELLGLTDSRRINVHAYMHEGAFRAACGGGHVEVMRELLALAGDRAIDVHADDEGAFRAACGGGHIKVVRELLDLTGDQRINVHAYGEGAFRAACEGRRVEVVRELLGLTGDRAIDVHADGEDAFRAACEGGRLNVVRELLGLTGDRRIDVHADGEDAFRAACANDHVEVVRELLALTGDQRIDVHADGEDAFQSACRRGRVKVVRELLALTGDRLINVHTNNERAFRAACANDHVEVVRELLALTGDQRIDVHADGEDAFRAACANDHVEVVRELLALTGDQRIDVHADGEDAFQSACEGGRVEVVRELLGLTGDRAIDVHANNERAFRAACGGGHVEVVRELLGLTGDQRINVHAQNDYAYKRARWCGHVEVVRELLALTGDRAIVADTSLTSLFI